MAIDYGTGIASIGVAGGLDMDPYWRRVTGPKVVAYAVARRLLVGKGSLWWAPDVGFGKAGLMGLALEGIRDKDVPTIERLIQAECEQDERVLGASVTVSWSAVTETLRVDIALELGDGPFRFVLLASSVTTSLLLSP